MYYLLALILIVLGVGASLFVAVLPYYIAYLIIDPSNFFGVMGVLILGSLMTPLLIFTISLVFGGISNLFGAFLDIIKAILSKSSKYQNYSHSTKTIQPLEPVFDEKKYRKAETNPLILCVVLGGAILGTYLFMKEDEFVPTSLDEDIAITDTTTYEEPIYTTTLEDLYSEAPPHRIEDDYTAMNHAVKQVFDITSEFDISALAKKVHDCYINSAELNLYCLYLDQAANIFDKAMSKQAGLTRNDYLTDARVIQRTHQYYYMPSGHIDAAQEHAQKIENELLNLLSQEYQLRQSRQNNVVTRNSAIDPVSSTTETHEAIDIQHELNHVVIYEPKDTTLINPEKLMRDDILVEEKIDNNLELSVEEELNFNK